MNLSPLLCIRHTSKTFVTRGFRNVLSGAAGRSVQALDDVGFDVAPGQVTALLGPNGAGKTTLINILCDLVRADQGDVRVAGHRLPAEAREARRRIGLVTTNERSFFWRLTGRQNLEFFAALQDVPRRMARSRSRELLAQFGLESHADRLFRVYSAGMKKRLSLARALLHDPPVLLMDEPTNSLDAAGADDLIELVRSRIRSMGKCVLWATHRLDEVEKLCDRVVVLTSGRIRFDDSVDRFREILRRRSSFQIELERVAGRLDRVREVAASLEAECGIDGTAARLRFRGDRTDEEISRALFRLLESGALVRSADVQPVSLNEIFIDLGRAAGGDPPSGETSAQRPASRPGGDSRARDEA